MLAPFGGRLAKGSALPRRNQNVRTRRTPRPRSQRRSSTELAGRLHPIGLIGLALAALAVSMLAATVPADAASRYLSKTTGTAADAYWTQVDNTPVGSSPFGNVHVGSLWVYETSKGRGDVFVFITDFDCEPGQLPGHGIAHEGEAPPDGCVHVGYRSGDGYGLEFTLGRKLASGSLRGPVTIYGGGHGGSVVGSPMIDMTWTATSAAFSSSSTYRYSDGGTTYTERYRSTMRTASLDGRIGPMSFDPALSGGSLSQFSMMSKGRTR